MERARVMASSKDLVSSVTPTRRTAVIKNPKVPLGAKGERTRRKILDATAELLEARPYGQIKVSEIARSADVVQPTFYTYFQSLEDVLLVLARERNLDAIAPHFEPSWLGQEGLEHVRAMVKAVTGHWRENFAIFNTTNLIADQGNEAFGRARLRQMRALLDGLESKVREAQASGRLDPGIQPRLGAQQAVALMVAIGQQQAHYESSGFNNMTVVDTSARMVHAITGGAAVGERPTPEEL